MHYSSATRAIIPVVVAIVFGILRKYVPAKSSSSLKRYERRGGPLLPVWVFNTATIGLGLAIAVGGFFALRSVNHLLAKLDGPALLHVYPVTAIWWFAPFFGALAVPWPLAIACLRRSGYRDDAAHIEADASKKSGFDSYRVMVGMSVFLVLPITLFTLPALPERLTLTDHDIRYTRYGALHPEVFRYADAQRATIVDGYRLRDGSFKRQLDLILDFKDGRRLSANAAGDGGSEPSDEEIKILLNKTQLTPTEVRTLGDIH